MKTAVIAAISAGVAVVAFIGVFVGIGSNQAEEQTDYQRELEESVSSKSTSQSPTETKQAEKTQPQSNDCSGSARCFTGSVTKITDGDTISVDGQSIRFTLVNTPEIGEDGYDEAKNFISSICPVGSSALVDEDDKQTEGSYGRIIAAIYCNGINLNESVLEKGHAEISTFFCSKSEFANEDWAKKYGCK